MHLCVRVMFAASPPRGTARQPPPDVKPHTCRTCSVGDSKVWIGTNAQLMEHLYVHHASDPQIGSTKQSLREVLNDARERTGTRGIWLGCAFVNTSACRMREHTQGRLRVCKCKLLPLLAYCT
jgi:hypothetical protein